MTQPVTNELLDELRTALYGPPQTLVCHPDDAQALRGAADAQGLAGWLTVQATLPTLIDRGKAYVLPTNPPLGRHQPDPAALRGTLGL